MMKKFAVMLMAILFSISVAGLGFAAEEKKPATAPAEKGAGEKASQPCAGGEKEMKKKSKKSKKAKKAKKDEGTTAAPDKPAPAKPTPTTPPTK